MEDIVGALGHLALGTRLKRLGERLQSQSQAVLDASGLDVQAAHMPVLAALDRLGPLSVGELARALGVSQPAATRSVAKLGADGWIRVRTHRDDLRVRTVATTRAGRELVAKAKRDAWPRIEAAVAEACTDGTLLARLAALEAALEAVPLMRRVESAEASRAGS